MNSYLGDKKMGEAKESTRSKLTGQVEDFLLAGGKIEQVPGGKTGMTKHLRRLELAREAGAQAKTPVKPEEPEGQA